MTTVRKPSAQTKKVLAAFLAKPAAPRHGYDLCKATGLKSGTLYPILMRLSDQGYLISEWRESEAPGRPNRHIYKLSEEGKRFARIITEAAKSRPMELKPQKA